MKKTVAFILCLVFALCLVGCGEKSTSGASAVEKYAKAGGMPECEFSLGDAYDDVLSAVEKAAEENEDEDADEHPEYSTYDDENGLVIDTAEFKYYFDTKSKKLECIAAFEDAYGFKHGTVITSVRDDMAENGYEAQAQVLQDDEAFFLYGIGERSKLEYEFGDNRVMFVFEESALCATVIMEK